MSNLAFSRGVASLVMIFILCLFLSVGNISLFLSASLFFSFILLVFQINKEDFFSPSTIVFVTALPYFLTVIFNSISYGEDSYYFNSQNIYLILFCFIFFGSFVFFDSYLKRIKIINLNFERKVDSNLVFILYSIIVGLYILVVATLFSLDIGSITRADIYKSKSTLFDVYKLFIYSFSVFYIWFIVCVADKKGKKLFFWLIPLLLFCSTDILILGDRKLAILLFAISAYVINTKKKINPIYIGYGILFGLFMWIYGYLRNTGINQWLVVLHDLDYNMVFSPDKSEFGAFNVIWNDYFSKYSSVQMQPTYLETFVQIIPTFLYPDRPTPPSLNFVKEFYPDLYSAGGGLAFNAILESMMNFSYLGPIVFAFILVFFGKFYNKSKLGILLGAIYIFCFSFTLRNDMISNLRIFLVLSAVILVCILIFCRVSKLKVEES